MLIEVEIDEIEVELIGAQTSCRKTVSNSDGSYSVTINEDLVLPDITFTDSDGTSSQVPSVKNITATPAGTCNLNVSNSDDSYSVNISANLELPDITFTDYDGSTSSVPAVQNVSATQLSRGYSYPRLTQQTSYRTGDAGWQYANIWNSIYVSSGTDQLCQELGADFYTLKFNNSFGNKFRFTTSAGDPATSLDFNSTNELIYDNYLGIQLIRMDESSVTWNEYIDNALAINSFGGGWYPVPVEIHAALTDLNASAGLNDIIIPGSSSWTATTRKDEPNTNRAYRHFFLGGYLFDAQLKTSSQRQNFAYKFI